MSCPESGICPPVVIYVALSAIGILSMLSPKDGVPVTSKMLWQSVAYTVIMTLLLYYLCRTCHNKLAWALLLLPFILVAVMFILFKQDFDRILKDFNKNCDCKN